MACVSDSQWSAQCTQAPQVFSLTDMQRSSERARISEKGNEAFALFIFMACLFRTSITLILPPPRRPFEPSVVRAGKGV